MAIFITPETLSTLCGSEFPELLDRALRSLANSMEEGANNPRLCMKIIRSSLAKIDEAWIAAAEEDTANGLEIMSEGSRTGELVVYRDGLPFTDAEIAAHLEAEVVPEVLREREEVRQFIMDYPLPSDRFHSVCNILREKRASYAARIEAQRVSFTNRMANLGKRGLFVAPDTWEEAQLGIFEERKTMCRLFRDYILQSIARDISVE